MCLGDQGLRSARIYSVPFIPEDWSLNGLTRLWLGNTNLPNKKLSHCFWLKCFCSQYKWILAFHFCLNPAQHLSTARRLFKGRRAIFEIRFADFYEYVWLKQWNIVNLGIPTFKSVKPLFNQCLHNRPIFSAIRYTIGRYTYILSRTIRDGASYFK